MLNIGEGGRKFGTPRRAYQPQGQGDVCVTPFWGVHSPAKVDSGRPVHLIAGKHFGHYPQEKKGAEAEIRT